MKALALLAALAACGGETGTIQVRLTTAPGSTLIADIQHLRVTITQPRLVVESDRTEDGFSLVIDVEAIGAAASLIVEGFDGNGTPIAVGSSPPFPVAAINAGIAVYVAPPLSIGAAPSRLPASRSGVRTTPLTYGIAIVGGRDGVGTVTDDMFIYNAYDHSLLQGTPLPAPRYAPILATGSNDGIYIIGGFDADSVATGTVFRFDSTAANGGTYTTFVEHPELARGDQLAVPLASERYIITGSPAVEVEFGGLAPRTDVGELLPVGASVTTEGLTYAVIGGAPIVRFFVESAEPTTVSSGAISTAVGLSNGRVAFVSVDNTRDLLVIDAATGTSQIVAGVLSVPRNGAAVAATSRHVVVAGGFEGDATSGTTHATADILDATTLQLITTVPCVPRHGAIATALLNEQVIIVGGVPETDTIELFTPPPPAL